MCIWLCSVYLKLFVIYNDNFVCTISAKLSCKVFYVMSN